MTDVESTMMKAVSLYFWKAKEKKVNLELKIGKQYPNRMEIDESRFI